MFRERYHGKRSLTPAVLLALSIGVLLWRLLWRLRPFRVAVEGSSMAPTVLPGDFLVATTGGRVRLGSVVVVRHPGRPGFELLKRVVGVGGDTPAGVRLESEEIWVVGDRQGASTDSRDFGPVSRADVAGVVRLRYWPLRRFGVIR